MMEKGGQPSLKIWHIYIINVSWSIIVNSMSWFTLIWFSNVQPGTQSCISPVLVWCPIFMQLYEYRATPCINIDKMSVWHMTLLSQRRRWKSLTWLEITLDRYFTFSWHTYIAPHTRYSTEKVVTQSYPLHIFATKHFSNCQSQSATKNCIVKPDFHRTQPACE